MLKIEKEYHELYGDISKDQYVRLNELLNTVKLHKCKKSVTDEIRRINRIKWLSLSYVIYLLPKATPRPRSGKNGIFYVKGAKDNKKIFEKFMLKQDISLILTPCKFICKTYYPIPKSMPDIEKVLAELGFIRPISKPDWDNVAKAYCDMCQGFLIYDDAQIVKGISEKYYSMKPRIEITIKYMESFDSVYNERKMKGRK